MASMPASRRGTRNSRSSWPTTARDTTDNISSYTVQNPYCTGATAATCSTATLSPFADESTPPSNSANGVSGTLAAYLPWQSRYVGTLNYTQMRQDQTFQPMTDNPSAVASPVAFFGGIPWSAVNFGFINGNPADPTNNLQGKIGTLLSNNVLTSQITPDLTSKLSYRYYDFDNETPRIIFPAGYPTIRPAPACGHGC